MLDTTYPTFNGLQVPRNATLIPCSTLEPFNSMFLERELSLLNIVEGLYTGGLLVNPLTAKTSTLFLER